MFSFMARRKVTFVPFGALNALGNPHVLAPAGILMQLPACAVPRILEPHRLLLLLLCLPGGLDAEGIPYTPAPAGMFLWVDLRAAFGGKAATWEDEQALWKCMVQQHKVVLTPGECNAVPYYVSNSP
jgi:hypothetical protein